MTDEMNAAIRSIHLPHHWRLPMFCLLISLTFIGCSLASSYYSMYQTWLRSETFAHGFFIVPIVLYLIWQKRDEVSQLVPKPQLWVLLALPPLIALSLIARNAEVMVVQQFVAVVIIWIAVAAIMGFTVISAIAFPLFYLLFAVPFGEFL